MCEKLRKYQYGSIKSSKIQFSPYDIPVLPWEQEAPVIARSQDTSLILGANTFHNKTWERQKS